MNATAGLDAIGHPVVVVSFSRWTFAMQEYLGEMASPSFVDGDSKRTPCLNRSVRWRANVLGSLVREGILERDFRDDKTTIVRVTDVGRPVWKMTRDKWVKDNLVRRT